jgi:hypothetical protein
MTTTAITGGDLKEFTYDRVTYSLITLSSLELAEYAEMKAMYYSTGGFKDGSYLDKFPSEKETAEQPHFTARKKQAYYDNAYATEIESAVTPIFSKNQDREVTGNTRAVKIVQNFVDNPSGRDEGMSEYMKRLQLNTKNYSSAFLVCDAPKERPATGKDDTNPAFMPYSYYLAPQQTSGYTFNNKGALQSLVYKADLDERSGCDDDDDSYIVWLRLEDGSCVNFNTKDGSEPTEEDVTPLPEFPVKLRELNTREEPNRLAKPRYYGEFLMSRAIYNLSSLITDCYRKNGFAILTYNGDVTNLILGNDSILQYPDGNNKPEFIAPPMAHVDSMKDQIQVLRIRIKENLNSTVVISAMASGTARIQADIKRIQDMTQETKELQSDEDWLVNTALSNYVDGSYNYTVVYDTSFESLTVQDSLEQLEILANSDVITIEAKKIVGEEMIILITSNNEELKEKLILAQQSGELIDESFGVVDNVPVNEGENE